MNSTKETAHAFIVRIWMETRELKDAEPISHGVIVFMVGYCNIEGVAWLTHSSIVTVSDKAKDEQPDECQCLDQSIHIFDLPDM